MDAVVRETKRNEIVAGNNATMREARIDPTWPWTCINQLQYVTKAHSNTALLTSHNTTRECRGLPDLGYNRPTERLPISVASGCRTRCVARRTLEPQSVRKHGKTSEQTWNRLGTNAT